MKKHPYIFLLLLAQNYQQQKINRRGFLIEFFALHGFPHYPKANIAENVATSLPSLLGFFLAVWLEESRL